MTHDEIRAWARRGVDGVTERFKKPTDKYAVVALLDTPEGTVVRGLPAEMFSTRKGREKLRDEWLPALVREVKATGIALITEVWEVQQGSEKMPLEYVERTHKGEFLLITTMTKDEVSHEQAEIFRLEGKAPYLGKWEDGGGPVIDLLERVQKELGGA